MPSTIQKKLSTVLLGAFLTCSSHASMPEWVSSEVLFNMMGGNEASKTGAGFYILGVHDATVGTKHCPTEKPSIAYLLDTTYAVLRLVNDKQAVSADQVVVFWLSKKYPCTKV